MDIKIILGTLAVVIGMLGYMFYTRGIFKGEVKPHAFTWSVWGILTSIAFFAQITEGGGPGAWVTGATAAMSFIFAIVGLGASSRAYIKKSDVIIFIFTLLAIPIWLVTENPLWAVILITIIDAVAFAPTFKKAYYHPQTENTWTYFLSATKFVVGIFALESFTTITVLYPASLVVANGAFVAMVIWRRNKSQNVAQ